MGLRKKKITMNERCCANCGAPLEPDSEFCMECGIRVSPVESFCVKCAKCGAPLEPDSAYCTACGEPVGTVKDRDAFFEDSSVADSYTICSCGTPLEPDSDYCTNCGKPVTRHSSEKTNKDVGFKLCPKCNRSVEADSQFCCFCGYVFNQDLQRCPICNAIWDPNKKVCGICGYEFENNLTPPEPEPIPPRPKDEAFGDDHKLIVHFFPDSPKKTITPEQEKAVQDNFHQPGDLSLM